MAYELTGPSCACLFALRRDGQGCLGRQSTGKNADLTGESVRSPSLSCADFAAGGLIKVSKKCIEARDTYRTISSGRTQCCRGPPDVHIAQRAACSARKYDSCNTVR